MNFDTITSNNLNKQAVLRPNTILKRETPNSRTGCRAPRPGKEKGRIHKMKR